jgi:ATP-binding cassette, subfamily B, bacterial PglK
MLETVRSALALLSPRERRRGALVLILVLMMAAVETAGVASVMPFLAVLANPALVETNPTLLWIYEFLDFQSVDAFLMALGFAAFGMVMLSAGVRILTHFVMHRFVEMRRYSIGQRLLETYLRQPYSFFLNRHSSEMIKNILSEVDQVVMNVYRPMMFIVAYSLVLLALVALLVSVDPVMATVVALVVSGLYAIFFLTIRGTLGQLGKEVVEANEQRFRSAGEALAGIKSIKLLGREHAYLSRFRTPSMLVARHVAKFQTLAQVPRFLVEAVAFGGIIALTIFLLAKAGGAVGGGFAGVVPILGLYAFAGSRILPAAQQIFGSVASLRYGQAAVKVVSSDFQYRAKLAQIHEFPPQRLAPQKSIVLDRISYSYPNTEQPALKDISLSIPTGTAVGFVGTTGSGKTTLVDVLLGLLRPQEGTISLDDEPLTEDNLRAWQQALGYVPQEIFLVDSTIAQNIALGFPPNQIDQTKVEQCAKLAQIHDFIMSELPLQYSTFVGDRGVRLSGGQRQRLGIARALYHDPDVLVFDEATSALDNVTEHAVMAAIEELSKQKTILLIAHRLSTVRACNQIVVLEKGRIAGVGSYEQLLATNPSFQNLASTSDLVA